jgi:hypothetical protein
MTHRRGLNGGSVRKIIGLPPFIACVVVFLYGTAFLAGIVATFSTDWVVVTKNEEVDYFGLLVVKHCPIGSHEPSLCNFTNIDHTSLSFRLSRRTALVFQILVMFWLVESIACQVALTLCFSFTNRRRKALMFLSATGGSIAGLLSFFSCLSFLFLDGDPRLIFGMYDYHYGQALGLILAISATSFLGVYITMRDFRFTTGSNALVPRKELDLSDLEPMETI